MPREQRTREALPCGGLLVVVVALAVRGMGAQQLCNRHTRCRVGELLLGLEQGSAVDLAGCLQQLQKYHVLQVEWMMMRLQTSLGVLRQGLLQACNRVLTLVAQSPVQMVCTGLGSKTASLQKSRVCLLALPVPYHKQPPQVYRIQRKRIRLLNVPRQLVLGQRLRNSAVVLAL